jgi:hypothetical protein
MEWTRVRHSNHVIFSNTWKHITIMWQKQSEHMSHDKYITKRWRQRDFHMTITGQSGGKRRFIVRQTPNLFVLGKNRYLRQCIACTRPWCRDKSFQNALLRRKKSSRKPKIREAINSVLLMRMFYSHNLFLSHTKTVNRLYHG